MSGVVMATEEGTQGLTLLSRETEAQGFGQRILHGARPGHLREVSREGWMTRASVG